MYVHAQRRVRRGVVARLILRSLPKLYPPVAYRLCDFYRRAGYLARRVVLISTTRCVRARVYAYTPVYVGLTGGESVARRRRCVGIVSVA